MVHGPLSATIAAIKGLGWAPSEPDRWMSKDRERTYLLPDKGWNPKAFEKELLAAVEQRLWGEASEGTHGKGLEHGVDLTVAKKHLVRLEANVEDRAPHTVALKIHANCCWTEADRYKASLIDSPLCRRCKVAEGTLQHHFWQCQANLTSSHPEIQRSQPLCKVANWGVDATPCFWLRGLTPKPWTDAIGMLDANEKAELALDPDLVPLSQVYGSVGEGFRKGCPAGEL